MKILSEAQRCTKQFLVLSKHHRLGVLFPQFILYLDEAHGAHGAHVETQSLCDLCDLCATAAPALDNSEKTASRTVTALSYSTT